MGVTATRPVSTAKTQRSHQESWKRLKSILGTVLRQGVLLSLVAIIVFPLFFMINNALKQHREFIESPLAFASDPSLSNFVGMLQNDALLMWFRNSFVLTFASVVICTGAAIFAAYALANMQFPGRQTLFNFITPLMVIPPIVMVIPLFVLFQKNGLVNNLIGPTVIYSGLMLPFTIFLLRNFFVTIPDSIQQSAKIDGANDLQILTRINLPLLTPAIVTSMVVNAVWAWNELLIALVFLQREELRTLIVGISISLQKRFTLDVPMLMAGLVIASIPMLLLYFVGQRSLVRGLTAGIGK